MLMTMLFTNHIIKNSFNNLLFFIEKIYKKSKNRPIKIIKVGQNGTFVIMILQTHLYILRLVLWYTAPQRVVLEWWVFIRNVDIVEIPVDLDEVRP